MITRALKSLDALSANALALIAATITVIIGLPLIIVLTFAGGLAGLCVAACEGLSRKGTK